MVVYSWAAMRSSWLLYRCRLRWLIARGSQRPIKICSHPKAHPCDIALEVGIDRWREGWQVSRQFNKRVDFGIVKLADAIDGGLKRELLLVGQDQRQIM